MPATDRPIRLGLISDTHGLVRPQALALLAGVDHILHAGDVCDDAVLRQLERVAPVTAVRGNNDVGRWAADLPHRAPLTVAGVRLLVIHDVADLRPRDLREIDLVIHGHSHRPRDERCDGVRYVNPGSAGPRRFTLPIAAGWLELTPAAIDVRLFRLDVDADAWRPFDPVA